MKFVLVFFISFLVVGCSLFTRPMEKPAIKDYLKPSLNSAASIGMLSLTPERRVVLHNFRTQRFCAEAPTEVGIDLSSASKLIAKSELPADKKAEIGLTLAASSGNSVLNKRSQGMQLFLANSYFVCQMYLNGAIDEKELLQYQIVVFNSAATLIEAEIPFLYMKGKDDSQEPESISLGFKPVDPQEIEEIFEQDEGTGVEQEQR